MIGTGINPDLDGSPNKSQCHRRYYQAGVGALGVCVIGLFLSQHHSIVWDEESSVYKKPPPPSSREALLGRFPVCFPPRSNYTSVKSFLRGIDGKFTPRDNNDRSTPRGVGYDHTCFVMKARYNCALPPGSNKSRAEDYKFVYHHRDEEDENGRQQPPCDLDDVIKWLGGPTGLGRALASSGIGKPSKPHYQVMLQGDSRLRQVIEALICRYPDQITNLTLTFESTDLDMNGMWHMSNVTHILRSNETGKPRLIGIANESDGFMSYRDIRRKGCHGSNRMDRFYYPGVSVPTSINGCSDDSLMVEFGRMIRFYYLFRPYLYSDEAILTTYEKLGMTTRMDQATGNVVLHDIDVLLWNRVGSMPERSLRFLAPERQNSLISFDWGDVQALMGEIQKKTIGSYFGAENPFITKPPDEMHACMPGYPDDMVNIMLFSLLGGLMSRPL
ncbi:hypothetical protein ACHAW5_004762 [Stephanodiscus triporus]|uniref:Uncharacterized protein n=1 Tax=Stephanodiscus triporus TaxID=2934178 RepID=A0ABD3MKN5_9STRA